MITAEQAIKRLYGTYVKFGITKDTITQLFMDGTGRQGFSPLVTYNLLRMSLGTEFKQQEYFTVTEIAEMLEATDGEVREQIRELQEQDGVKPIESMGGWKWYFPNGIK